MRADAGLFVHDPSQLMEYMLWRYFVRESRRKRPRRGKEYFLLRKLCSDPFIRFGEYLATCESITGALHLVERLVTSQGNQAVRLVSVIPEDHAERIQAALNEDAPYRCADDAGPGERTSYAIPLHANRYLFGRYWWELTNKDFFTTGEELRLLFLEAVDRDRQRLERLRRKFSGAAGERVASRRERIPEEVRIYVWRRDEGRCVNCGSQEKLEFDHVIPVSKGGGNTARNIQLLCEACNREKTDRI